MPLRVNIRAGLLHMNSIVFFFAPIESLHNKVLPSSLLQWNYKVIPTLIAAALPWLEGKIKADNLHFQ